MCAYLVQTSVIFIFAYLLQINFSNGQLVAYLHSAKGGAEGLRPQKLELIR